MATPKKRLPIPGRNAFVPSPSQLRDGRPADVYNCRTRVTKTFSSMKAAKVYVASYRRTEDPQAVDWILMANDGALYRSEIAVTTCGRRGRAPALCWRRFARKDLAEKMKPSDTIVI